MGRDKAVEQTFKPVRQDFGNNFVNDVAEANKAELVHRRSPQLFRNKDNEHVIMLLLKLILSKKIPDRRKNHILDNMPIFLVK
jgi:hypothetical protein